MQTGLGVERKRSDFHTDGAGSGTELRSGLLLTSALGCELLRQTGEKGQPASFKGGTALCRPQSGTALPFLCLSS